MRQDRAMSERVRWLVGIVVLVAALLLAHTHLTGRAPRAYAASANTIRSRVELTVEVNGDILVHQPVWQQGARRRSRQLRLRADARARSGRTSGPPTSRSATSRRRCRRARRRAIRCSTRRRSSRARSSWAGWRICDTASNHSVDQGQYGIDQTGLGARSRRRPAHRLVRVSRGQQRRTLIVTVKGVRVAFLAYTEMTNGIPLPHPWSVNIASVAAVRRAARIARERGAQVVIVNFHWGTAVPVGAQTRSSSALARALPRDPDITAIVGQHVHVVQPIVRVHGKLVVYGEGQILSNEDAACCPVQTEDGMLVFLHIVVRRLALVRQGHLVPADVGPPPRLHGAADRRRAGAPPGARRGAPRLVRADRVSGGPDPGRARADPRSAALTPSPAPRCRTRNSVWSATACSNGSPM